MDNLTLCPIGFARTGRAVKFDLPHQPDSDRSEVNRIELVAGRQLDLALQDLDGFDRIWLLWWFHRNPNWRPRVLPPRGPAKRRGVLSTRSPHRPNPIGLTCVSLLAVEGLTLTVGPLDLVDGTPILDIKPYLPAVDSFPESRIGWLEEVESAATPRFHVEVTDVVEADLAWLEATWGIDFRERAFGILSRDPSPHRTRRILEVEPGLFRLACGPWRLYYRVEEDRVTVLEIKVGYSEATLFERVDIPHRDGLFAFLARKSAPGTAE